MSVACIRNEGRKSATETQRQGSAETKLYMIQSQGKNYLHVNKRTHTNILILNLNAPKYFGWHIAERRNKQKVVTHLTQKKHNNHHKKQATLQHQTNTYYNELNNKIAEQQSAHNSAWQADTLRGIVAKRGKTCKTSMSGRRTKHHENIRKNKLTTPTCSYCRLTHIKAGTVESCRFSLA